MQNNPVILNLGIWDLVSEAGPLVKLVLLLLALASLLCWAIVFLKHKMMRTANIENTRFLGLFWQSKNLDEIYSKIDTFSFSPVAQLFKSGFKELQKFSSGDLQKEQAQIEIENIQRSLSRAAQTQIARLEKHVSWLATTASASPFVGLFGTVWGIMNSFRKIGATGAANLSVVAPGISEALIATAVGLAAAIPAVIAYNHFVNQIKKQSVEMDCFSQDFLNIIQRGLMGSPRK